jgi:hypothetical protein
MNRVPSADVLADGGASTDAATEGLDTLEADGTEEDAVGAPQPAATAERPTITAPNEPSNGRRRRCNALGPITRSPYPTVPAPRVLSQ